MLIAAFIYAVLVAVAFFSSDHIDTVTAIGIAVLCIVGHFSAFEMLEKGRDE
jgi:hypothetical protein